jgi:hypothetical protein
MVCIYRDGAVLCCLYSVAVESGMTDCVEGEARVGWTGIGSLIKGPYWSQDHYRRLAHEPR